MTNQISKFMLNTKQLLTKTTFSTIGVIIWIVIFYKLTREVVEKETLVIDINIAQYIYAFRTPFLNNFFSFVTEFGGSLLIIFTIVITAILLFKKYYTQATHFVLAIGISFILNLIFKNLVARPRPNISQLLVEKDFSFPSGHSSGATIFYLSLIYLVFSLTPNKTIRYTTVFISMSLIALILFSRVYLGVHYPTDVLGGFIESLIVFLIFFIIDKLPKSST